MPTFCRHNRFIERCPICSKTLPGNEPARASSPRKSSTRARSGGERAPRARVRGEGVRVHHEGRAADDGYRSELVPGLRASADALRLAEEIAFSSARLLALAADPPGLYGEIRALAAASGEGLERATWACFLIAYLCPLEEEEPFAGIRLALSGPPGAIPDLEGVPLGPRTSHDPERGADTLVAYTQWVSRAGGAASPAGDPGQGPGPQAVAFTGDPGWSPQRRFERLFERLALPGFSRVGRYEMLVTLGRLGLYPLTADSLHLAGAGGLATEDSTALAAKRVFGIGDLLLLERRAAGLAEAVGVPVEALDLALANWLSPPRVTMGFPHLVGDDGAFARAGEALGL